MYVTIIPPPKIYIGLKSKAVRNIGKSERCSDTTGIQRYEKLKMLYA